MNIKEYSKLLGVKMTEAELVASHIRLKEELKEYREKTKQMWDDEQEKVRKYCEENNTEYVSIDKLSDMTLAEIISAYYIGEE